MTTPTPFRSIVPSSLSPSDWHPFMVGAVAPRPVAFVSTVAADGSVNLSPYSFFNCFGSNPPILAFSPANRVRDNSQKHTLQNVREVAECVVHICSYDMVEQMSLASTEYAKGVDEFVKAGFTAVPSQRVRPPRVLEAPAAFECVVEQVMELGQNNGAGNLVLCRVVLAHFREDIILPSGIGIDPVKLDAIARLGGDWYSRSAATLFEVPKPNRNLGIGIDQLPAHIRTSDILTGNNLGRLANIEVQSIPTPAEVQAFRQEPIVSYTLSKHAEAAEQKSALVQLGKQLLEEGRLLDAWKVLLLAE
ncbi:flavin reductase family protein [Hymenobacter sp. 102]|uniref:flavin reductase family protein n=1 Tax=Hymenobacter sp. 102 TaxID=3403152 RepID=UPI003CEFD661